jgi:hypothetical protein
MPILFIDPITVDFGGFSIHIPGVEAMSFASKLALKS